MQVLTAEEIDVVSGAWSWSGAVSGAYSGAVAGFIAGGMEVGGSK